MRAPDKPGVSNLVEILAVARGIEPEQVERELEGQGYGALKEATAEAVVEYLPRYASATGRCARTRPSSSARSRAGPRRPARSPSPVVGDVREAMGVGPPRASRRVD